VAALLPRDQAKFYTRVYREHDELLGYYTRLIETTIAQNNFDSQFAGFPKVPSTPIYPDLSRMSATQLDEESALLTKLWIARRNFRTRLDWFYVAESAVVQGSNSEDDIVKLYHPYPPTGSPSQPAMPAAEPNPTDPSVLSLK